MGYGKSSGVDVINYSYIIKDDTLNILASRLDKKIIEFYDNKFNHSWYLIDLLVDLKNNNLHEDKDYSDSFLRTKEWVIKNHPELML
jgi:hypothetical protein